MWEIVWRCHVVVYVVMGVVVVASGSSPSAYIRGLIRRIDRGDPNDVKAHLVLSVNLDFLFVIILGPYFPIIPKKILGSFFLEFSKF